MGFFYNLTCSKMMCICIDSDSDRCRRHVAVKDSPLNLIHGHGVTSYHSTCVFFRDFVQFLITHRETLPTVVDTMARGNQREKSREKNLKAAAAAVRMNVCCETHLLIYFVQKGGNSVSISCAYTV